MLAELISVMRLMMKRLMRLRRSVVSKDSRCKNAYTMHRAEMSSDKVIIGNLSGRGDKDVQARVMGDDLK